jgi:hypothetical protein
MTTSPTHTEDVAGDSREEFVALVRALVEDLRTQREEWENDDLESYLEALAAWTADLDGYCRSAERPLPEQPDWKLLGEMLLAARVYE